MEPHQLEQERSELLQQIEDWLEWPVLLLGFVWLALLLVELLWGLTPLLESFVYIIWAIFVVDFAVRLLIAPHRMIFLKDNVLTAISLLAPALRVLRIARLARVIQASRAARGLRLLRVVSSLNRGMRALRSSMRRRGFRYVVVLTCVVTFVGAAGMYAFEADAANGFQSYGDALWWTAMLMTTLGSEAWPLSAEGRILGFLLALYGFAVFGYTTATLATFFIGRDAENEQAELPGAQSITALQAEIAALRADVHQLLLAQDGRRDDAPSG